MYLAIGDGGVAVPALVDVATSDAAVEEVTAAKDSAEATTDTKVQETETVTEGGETVDEELTPIEDAMDECPRCGRMFPMGPQSWCSSLKNKEETSAR